jgi:hypothetical protein
VLDRKRNDMQGWIERSREMVDVCRRIGPEAETDALRMKYEYLIRKRILEIQASLSGR